MIYIVKFTQWDKAWLCMMKGEDGNASIESPCAYNCDYQKDVEILINT